MVAAFFFALQFLTRIPTPDRGTPSPSVRRWSIAFYPLVGALVGLFAAGAYSITAHFFTAWIGAVVALAASALLTGALHEDGLADCADGLGAGGDSRRMLEIMRDSRNGTFGVLALILSSLLKVGFIGHLSPLAAPAILVAVASLGRFAALLWGGLFKPAQRDGLGIAFTRQWSWPPVALAVVLAAATLGVSGLLLQSYMFAPALIASGLFVVYCRRRLGGITGDVLGGSIQVFEIVAYAAWAWS